MSLFLCLKFLGLSSYFFNANKNSITFMSQHIKKQLKLFQPPWPSLPLLLPRMFWRLLSREEPSMRRRLLRPKPAEMTARLACTTGSLRYRDADSCSGCEGFCRGLQVEQIQVHLPEGDQTHLNLSAQL